MADLKPKIRTYRHFSAAQLDSAYVRISNKLRFDRRKGQPMGKHKKNQLEKLLVDIDYERSCRF
jgi:hypothetical protein